MQRVAAVTTDEVLPAAARGATTREDEVEQAQRAEIEGEPKEGVHTSPGGWDSNRRRAHGARIVPNAYSGSTAAR
jgi:hypothetical protein